MADSTPEHQDRSLFGLFGKKDEHQQEPENVKNHGNLPVPVAPSYHQETPPAVPLHATDDLHSSYEESPKHGHGHEGGGGIMSKLHRSDSSSSSSSDEEEEDGKKKKKGLKSKMKENLPGGHESEDQHYHGEEGEKKQGFIENIKEQTEGFMDKPSEHKSEEHRHHEESGTKVGNKNEEHHHHVEEGEEEGLVDKIKEKLSIKEKEGDKSEEQYHHGEEGEKKQGYPDMIKEKFSHKNEEQHHHVEEGEKKQGFMDKIKEEDKSKDHEEEDKRQGSIYKIKQQESDEHHPHGEQTEKKQGFMDKIKQKIPGFKTKEEAA